MRFTHAGERWSASLRGGRAGSRSVYAGVTERDVHASHAFGPRRISWWLCAALAAEELPLILACFCSARGLEESRGLPQLMGGTQERLGAGRRLDARRVK